MSRLRPHEVDAVAGGDDHGHDIAHLGRDVRGDLTVLRALELRPAADTLAVGSGYTFGGSSDSIAVAILTDGTVQPIMPGGSTVAVFAGYFWFTPPDVVP